MRLEKSSYGLELHNWLVVGIPDLTNIFLYMFGGSDYSLGSKIELIKDDDGTLVTVYCGVNVPPSKDDPVREQIVELTTIDQTFRRLAKHLQIPIPPMITLLRDEKEWIDAYGIPAVDIGNCRISVSERRDPTKQSSMPPDFDIWRLFEGDEANPLANFAASLAALSDKQKQSAANAINWHIDAFLNRLLEVEKDGCITDSEAIHAAALMCGGQKMWNAALKSPTDYQDIWPVDDDAEDIIAFSEWG